MKQKSECLNGGYSVPPMNNCTCPPGFIGKLCETGNLTTIVLVILYIYIYIDILIAILSIST